MTSKEILESLNSCVGKEITIEIASFSFCTEEDHPAHGDERRWEKQVFFHECINPHVQDFRNLALKVKNNSGAWEIIPFLHMEEWLGGYEFTVIAAIFYQNKQIFQAKIKCSFVDPGDPRVFEYGY